MQFRIGLALAATLALVALPVLAEPGQREFLQRPDGRGGPVVTPGQCEGGVRYDDGSFEGGVGFANANLRGAYVMAFDLPPRFQADGACLCWTRSKFSTGTAVNFDVVFYAANGEAGAPGTLLGRVPARAQDVPEFVTEGVGLFRVPLPQLPFALPTRVYIGAEWEPFVDRQFFLCNDATAGTPLREAWSSTDGVEWSTTSDIRPSYRALGVVLFGSAPAAEVALPLAGAGIALGVLLLAGLRSRRRRRDQIGSGSGGG
jgi:hypothetical protein